MSRVPSVRRYPVPCLLLAFLLVAAGPAAARTSGRVLAEAQAQCPVHPSPYATLPLACRTTRTGNAVTGTFSIPHGAWGIAYAFSCRPGHTFMFVVGLPAMDASLPDTFAHPRGARGRGYVMDTGRGLSTMKTIPSYWTGIENVQISSDCAWHIVVVQGPAGAVAAHVPPLPRLRR